VVDSRINRPSPRAVSARSGPVRRLVVSLIPVRRFGMAVGQGDVPALHGLVWAVILIVLSTPAVARAQGAKLWELRAAVNLARLLNESDRGAEARELLRGAYAGFDEGVDLPDLRIAQDLLKSLRS